MELIQARCQTKQIRPAQTAHTTCPVILSPFQHIPYAYILFTYTYSDTVHTGMTTRKSSRNSVAGPSSRAGDRPPPSSTRLRPTRGAVRVVSEEELPSQKRSYKAKGKPRASLPAARSKAKPLPPVDDFVDPTYPCVMRIREARRRGDADEADGLMSGMIEMSSSDTSESADQVRARHS